MLFESTLGLAIMYVANVRAITKKKRGGAERREAGRERTLTNMIRKEIN